MTDISLQVTNEGPESTGTNSLPDPWPQGLGIFDLTAMEWKEGYDPAAAPYVTPDAVKAYYQRNGRGPASWSNGVVQAWFTETTSNHTYSSSFPSTPHPSSSTPQPGSSTPRPGSSTPRPGLPGSPRSSENNISAVAGGTVGGTAALTLIALLAFFSLRRHRRRGRLAVLPSDTEYRKPELDTNGNNTIRGVIYPLAEMQGFNDPMELPGREVSPTELPS